MMEGRQEGPCLSSSQCRAVDVVGVPETERESSVDGPPLMSDSAYQIRCCVW